MNRKPAAIYVLPALALLLIASLLGGCANYTSVREHPDFANHQRRIETVALLPPQVEFTQLVFNGDNERLPDRETSIAATLTAVVPEAFSSRGYKVSSVNLDERVKADPNLGYELEQLRKAYGTASNELYDKGMVTEEESRKFNINIGHSVNLFGDLADADALILVHYSGFTKSDGLMTKEIASNVLLAALTGSYYEPARSGGGVEIALIDSSNGDVLWSNVNGGTVGSGMVASQALKDLPPFTAEPAATPASVAATPKTDSGSETAPEHGPADQDQAKAAETAGADTTLAPPKGLSAQ